LYTEPADEAELDSAAHEGGGFWRRTIRALHESWRQAVHAAHLDRSADAGNGRLARARDWIVRRIAESIAEQRTLWSLRSVTSASFVYPADLTESSATAIRQRLLAEASRHHGWWPVFESGESRRPPSSCCRFAPISSGTTSRSASRLSLSWRGARQALDHVSWRPSAEPIPSEPAAGASLGERADASRRHRPAPLEPSPHFRSCGDAHMLKICVIYSALTP
jgi:hypothetical protein